MLLTIIAEDHIRLDTGGEDGLVVEGESFGPLPMLAASLALCTVSVIQSYADGAGVDVAGFGVEVRWNYVEDPYRVGRYDVTLHLPTSVPQSRHRAIVRVADTCTVHATLIHPPAIETVVETFEPGQHADVEHQHHHHHHHSEHEEA